MDAGTWENAGPMQAAEASEVTEGRGSEEPGGGGPPAPTGRHRIGFKVLSVALAAIVVAGGSFLLFGRRTNADAAVAQAVNSALASNSADLVISGSAGADGATFTISGTGAVDFQQNSLQMAIHLSGAGQQITEQAVYLDKVIYLNLGDKIGQVLPGKSWLSLDLSQLSGQGASSLGGDSPFSSDPAAALQALRQEGNTATDLGPSTVNGTKVEGYSVQVNPATIKKEIAQANLPAWMKQAADSVSETNVNYKVFVDTSGHLARMTTDLTASTSGTSVKEGFSMDFVHYGTPVNITAPPSGEVATFQSFLQAAESHATATN
jgi:hypothetical protein